MFKNFSGHDGLRAGRQAGIRGNAQSRYPQDPAIADENRNIPSGLTGNFHINKKVLEFFAAGHAQRDKAVTRPEGADRPGEGRLFEVEICPGRGHVLPRGRGVAFRYGKEPVPVQGIDSGAVDEKLGRLAMAARGSRGDGQRIIAFGDLQLPGQIQAGVCPAGQRQFVDKPKMRHGDVQKVPRCGLDCLPVEAEPEPLRLGAQRGQVVRRFRALPIGGRATFVVLPIPRVQCQACGAVRQVEVSFADPRRSYTSSFERYALELGRRMTIRDVAAHLGVGWDLIKDIPKRDLSRRFAKPKLKHLRHIAIDEIAVAKGHRYLTVVMDLDSGAVVFVGDGKGPTR